MSGNPRASVLTGRYAAAAAVFLAALLFGYLNRHSTTQSGALLYHINLMNYYRGIPGYDYCLYPVWGYPLLMSLFSRWQDVIVPQVLLGSLVASLFYLQVWGLLRERISGRLWALAALAAVPYFALISVRWPAAIQSPLIVWSVMLLLRSIRPGKALLSVPAGLLLGLACNFRSEYLYLPVFLITGFAALKLLRPRSLSWSRFGLLLAFAVSCWLAMVPLGLDRLANTGRFSIKVGNGDWTNVYFSIGQYPANRMSLRFDDGWVEGYLRENIEAPYDTTQQLHMQAVANEFSRRAFFAYLRDYPGDFLLKMAHNARSILAGGFYYGQIEAGLGEDAALRMVLLKEFYKELVGISHSVFNMQVLFSRGLTASEGAVSLSEVINTRSLLLLPLFLMGAFFGVVNLLFYLLLLARLYARLKAGLKFSFEELVFLMCIAYGNGLMTVGMYENRFANVYYLFLAALVVIWFDGLLPPVMRRFPKRTRGARGPEEEGV